MGKVKRFTMAMALAALAGAVAGVLLAPKKGTETREQLKKKADELTKKYKESKSQIETRAKKVFKDASHESVGIYMRARGIIIAEIHKANKKGGLDKKSFMSLVDKVVNQLKREKKVAVPVAKALADELKRDWTVISKNFSK